MAEEMKKRQPITIKNLASFKRLITPGTEFITTFHDYHPELIGLVRVVTEVQSNAFYSVIRGQPDHKYSTCNHGKGIRTDFEKASNYIFDGTTIKQLNTRRSDRGVLFEFEIFGHEKSMREQIQEDHDMKDSECTKRLVAMYKEEYPPGTRIMLLRMGDDPRPVGDNTRGTVIAVDDIGTLHCSFDNGRALGVVPGEDSFRKLTSDELAEEQTMTGPVMEM